MIERSQKVILRFLFSPSFDVLVHIIAPCNLIAPYISWNINRKSERKIKKHMITKINALWVLPILPIPDQEWYWYTVWHLLIASSAPWSDATETQNGLDQKSGRWCR